MSIFWHYARARGRFPSPRIEASTGWSREIFEPSGRWGFASIRHVAACPSFHQLQSRQIRERKVFFFSLFGGLLLNHPCAALYSFWGCIQGKLFFKRGTSSNYFKKQGRVYEKLLFKKRTLILNSLNPTPQISERIHFLWEWINLANTLPVNLAKRSNQSIWRIFLRGVKVATQQKQSIWQIY